MIDVVLYLFCDDVGLSDRLAELQVLQPMFIKSVEQKRD